MSKQYDNTNTGVLFKNDRKEKDTHPDYTGNINADGKEYWLNAWVKDGKNGKYFSFSLKAKDAKPANASASAPIDDLDSEDVPF